jgi:hypothetical protein
MRLVAKKCFVFVAHAHPASGSSEAANDGSDSLLTMF